ncbi:hypothetical protein EPI10_021334 [Gossypium australe]|uniref:Uncharacterized protein n=1 Tax=Gossypium australe TaxID=47621 RepID=A0A5B6WGM5_9ROSI|nr:hypothetical protein EPI10_021334 [Gossypium australe]
MTWDEPARKLLQKFFPISKTLRIREKILMFKYAHTADCLSGYDYKFCTTDWMIRWSDRRILNKQNVRGYVRIDRKYGDEFLPVAN